MAAPEWIKGRSWAGVGIPTLKSATLLLLTDSFDDSSCLSAFCRLDWYEPTSLGITTNLGR